MFKLKVLGLATIAIGAFAFTTIGIEVAKNPTPKTFNRVVTDNDPPCLQMYYYIEHYAEEYGIPKRYAYGIAYKETHYRGPFDWKYNHALTSSAGAVGPMQIMPQYAHPHVEGDFTREELKTDIAMNVRASMSMLHNLKNRFGDWKVVFGYYNTGRPIVNQYAIDVYNHKPQWKTTSL